MKQNLIYRQFYNNYHKHLQHIFVQHNNGLSKYKDGRNLFGWGSEEQVKKYTNSFQLELIYD